MFIGETSVLRRDCILDLRGIDSTVLVIHDSVDVHITCITLRSLSQLKIQNSSLFTSELVVRCLVEMSAGSNLQIVHADVVALR